MTKCDMKKQLQNPTNYGDIPDDYRLSRSQKTDFVLRRGVNLQSIHLKHGDAKATEYRAETIVATMDAGGIDKSVVFAISTTTKNSMTIAELLRI